MKSLESDAPLKPEPKRPDATGQVLRQLAVGPLLTLALAAGLLWLGPIANATAIATAVLMLAVIFAAGYGGQWAGLAGAALGWMYFLVAYATGRLPGGVALLIALALVLPAAAWATWRLHTRLAGPAADRQAVLAERTQADATLERDRQIWASVLANIPDFIYVKDLQGRYVLASQAMIAALGAESLAAVVGKTDFDFCEPGLAEQYRADDLAILQSGQPFVNREMSGLTKNSDEVWSLTTKTPWRDAQGNIVGIIGVGRDITQRRQAQLAQHAAEAQYRTLVEQLPAVTYIVEVGEPAKVLYVSPQVETLLGLLPADFPADTAAWTKHIHPEDQARAQAALEQADQTGTGIDLDFRMVRRDGSLVWLRNRAVQLPGPRSTRQLHGVLLDITSHKVAEQALRDSEQRFQLVTWATNDAVWDRNLKTQRLWWNDGLQKLFQYDLASISYDEAWWLGRIHQEDRDRVKRSVERALAGADQFWSKEYRFQRADGSYAQVFDRGYIIRDDQQLPERMVGAMMDISDRRRMEEALREAESRYRTLVEQLPEVVYVAAWGETGRWSYVSPKIEALLGYAPHEWMADPAMWAKHIHPEDRQRVLDNEARDRLREPGSSSVIDYRMFTRDGRTIWVRDSAILLPGEPGHPPTYHGVLSDITAQRRSQEALQEANQILTQWLQHSERRTMELGLLNELNGLLQNCHDLNEACRIASPILRRLFADEYLSLYLLATTRKPIVAQPIWNDRAISDVAFDEDDCWALRRNQIYLVDSDHPGPVCAHLGDPPPEAYLCVPISVQGRPRALLHIHKAPAESETRTDEQRLISDGQRQLARTVADSMGLAFSNLELRDSLREQSIRDALTGLYNRRYMEESLEREILRATRHTAPVGIVMLDIDHFKAYNDAHGHAAGDVLLRELGRVLRQQIRGADIACRYGGEEFTLILPEASLEVTRQRAEQLREAADWLRPELDGHLLASVTVSMGVAGYPEHGATADQVLRAADEALYRAKREGRNRVVVYGGRP